MRKTPKIVFMGTSEFAVPILNSLSENFDVELVVTQPDRRAGRGLKLKPPPVKLAAEALSLKISQPNRVSEIENKIKEIKPDFIVVCAYGEILPESVLSAAKIEPLNVHASLLPKYRGASPIQSALLNGEKFTGVSVIRMIEKLDAGPIFAQRAVFIEADDNAQTLHDRLSSLGAELITETIKNIVDGKIKNPVPQDEKKATYCRKIKKQDGKIDFSEDAVAIFNKVRAFTPWPSAYAFMEDGRRLVITKALPSEGSGEPGSVIKKERDFFEVACGRDSLKVLRVKPEGKREMSAADFLKGYSGKLKKLV